MRKTLWGALLMALTFSAFGLIASAPAGAQVADPGCPSGTKTYFVIEYNDGGVDSGCVDDKVVTGADVPGLLATELHVSCSDDFVGVGTTEKSDLGDPNRFVTSYSIYEVKDGRLDKLKCGGGGDGSVPGGLDDLPIDTSNCNEDSKQAYLIEYNDSDVVGVDSGCSESNTVTRADDPNLIAEELHVSCSDDFVGVGTTEKSDLGSPTRSVVAYTIWKIKDGQVEEVKCGQGTPIPGGGVVGLTVLALGVGGVVLYGNRRRLVRNPTTAAV